MEMQQVRYFLAVAKALNFTQAAEDCHIAQPTLSRSIRNLELEFGGDLFRRERGLTHLTDLGRLILPLLVQCYESAQEAKRLALAYRNGGTAPLRLAVSHSVNLALLVPALTELVKALPGLELTFFRGTAQQVADRLKVGEAELAVAGSLGDAWDRLESWSLFEEGYAFVVGKSHPLALRNRVGLLDIVDTRLICRLEGDQVDCVNALLESHDIKRDLSHDVISDQDLAALLEANVAAAIMPESACSSAHLRSVVVDGLNVRRSVYLYAVAGRERTPAAAGLLKLLRAADWPSILPVTGRKVRKAPKPASRGAQPL